MDIRKVKKLIELLKESGVAEIEIHEGEESVRISSHHAMNSHPTVVQAPQTLVPQARPGRSRSRIARRVWILRVRLQQRR